MGAVCDVKIYVIYNISILLLISMYCLTYKHEYLYLEVMSCYAIEH